MNEIELLGIVLSVLQNIRRISLQLLDIIFRLLQLVGIVIPFRSSSLHILPWGKVMQISLITQIGISSVSVWGGTSGKDSKILVLSNLKQASFEVGLSLT